MLALRETININILNDTGHPLKHDYCSAMKSSKVYKTRFRLNKIIVAQLVDLYFRKILYTDHICQTDKRTRKITLHIYK